MARERWTSASTTWASSSSGSSPASTCRRTPYSSTQVTPSDLGSAGDPPVIRLENGVALYERDAGVLWDRIDAATGDRKARFGRELVVTSTMPNGNYTYTVEYVFRLDGGIDVLAGATGTLLTRGVASAAAGNAFGTLVAPLVAAPSHQHFFNFRVDFDVDGVRNRLIQADTQTVPSADGNAFDTDESVVEREGFRDAAPTADRRWIVESTTRARRPRQPHRLRAAAAREHTPLLGPPPIHRCNRRPSPSMRCGRPATPTGSSLRWAIIPTRASREKASRST